MFGKLKGESVPFKFISMIMACTGGGIIVPILINGIPVPLANDAYPIAIAVSFALHYYFPILREVLDLSALVKVSPLIMKRHIFKIIFIKNVMHVY